jgi:subtilisin family serine protease
LASTVPLIRANETTARGFAGNGVSVVILDTGIDGDHDFFGTNGSRIVEERCFSNAGGAGGRVSLCPNGENVDDDAEVETPFARLVGSISATTVPTWLELQREVESPMPLPRLMEWRQEQASSLCRFSRGLTTPPVVPSVHPVSDPLAAIK